MPYEPDDSCASREGPKVEIIRKISCEGCVNLLSEYYSIEDGNSYDSGTTYICKATPTNKLVRGADGQLWAKQIDDVTKTPEWCPYYPDELG